MATQLDNTSGGEGDDVFMEDQRDGKKKKKNPFKKMKNFFRGGSKKRKVEEDDGPISRSTGALHHHIVQEDDDDDGGFKRKGLAGSRSISEDSVFQQEPKEAGIAVLKGQAASMEAINTGFQSEPIDRPSQDSYQSFNSFNGSDEDLFSTNWKAGVASVKTRSYSGNDIDKTMEISDFEDVSAMSTSLSNEAAKHRISVKPKSRRLSSKMSMKLKEKPNVQVLSDVKEEPSSGPAPSGTSQQQESSKQERPSSTEESAIAAKPGPSSKQHKTLISTTIPVGSPPKPGASIIPRSEPREIPQTRRVDESELQKARSLSPISTSPVSKATLDEVKLKTRPLSGKFEGVELRREPLHSENELSKAFNKAKRFSQKYDDDGNIVDSSSAVVTKKDNEVKRETEPVKVTTASVISDKKPVAMSQPSSTQAQVPAAKTATTSSATTGTTGVTFVLKKEPLRPSVKKTESSEISASKLTNSGTKDLNNTVKQQEQKKVETAATLDVKSHEKIGSSEKLASPREDYRIKRQARSKTLPVSQEIMDTKKEESGGQKPSSRSGSPPLKATAKFGESVGLNTTPQSKRASWAPSSAASSPASSEPEWIVKSRLKKMEHDNQNKEVKLEIKKDSKPEIKTSVSNTEKLDDKPENETKTTEKQPITTNIKSVIDKEKSTSVRSWGQPQSVKSTVQSSAKVSDKISTTTTTSASNVSVTVRPPVSSAKPSITSDKPLPQSVKPPVSSLSKPASDKPLSQSVRASPLDSKFSQFGTRAGSQKGTLSGSTVQPLSQSVKVTTQSAGISATKEPVKTSVSPVKSSVLSDTKKPVTIVNKKPEIENKQEPVTKQTALFEKPKSVAKPVKPETSSSNIPAWKQALNQRKNNNPLAQQVKIEIIDKEPEKPVEKKVEQKPVVEMREKPKAAPEKCSDSNRSSKVLDMVKSFQKLQVT